MGKESRHRVLTRAEKEAIQAYDIPWKDYLYAGSVTDTHFKIVHKDTGRFKLIDKYARRKKR